MTASHEKFISELGREKEVFSRHRLIEIAFILTDRAVDERSPVAALRAATAVRRLHDEADHPRTDDSLALVFQRAARETGRTLNPVLKEAFGVENGDVRLRAKRHAEIARKPFQILDAVLDEVAKEVLQNCR